MIAEREVLKRQYGDLFSSIERILFEADPIDINYLSNTDEYSPEAGTIIPRLGSAQSPRDVEAIVYEEFCCWFDPDEVGTKERYASVAASIWEVWCAFNRSSAG